MVTKSEIIGEECHIHFDFVGQHEDCPDCGQQYRIHQWREVALLGPPVGLHKKSIWHVRRCVYECRCCGCFRTQSIPFRLGSTSCTTYLAKAVCEDLEVQNESVKNVARRYGIKWDMVKSIHKTFLRMLAQRIPEPEGPRIAAVDEFSIEKHHRYATFVIDAENKYPLYLHRGNSADDFRPFFEMYDETFYARIEAFAMDQNASYSSVVRECLPGCAVVCDYFHMIKNYNDDVIERIRTRMVRMAKIRRDPLLARMFKGSKRLLMKRLEPDDWEARLALQDLMSENADLDMAIHMRELLQKLYDGCRDEELMRGRWERWCAMARESGIPELMRYAESKRRRTPEIISHARFAISSGVIEGCMNKIKVLKRVACGFRDWEYFFLRIWHMFLPEALKRLHTARIWVELDPALTGKGENRTWTYRCC
ncbi:MAG: ISL3 family transposase [Sphaerochaetaceae bacterium]|nr:ISL3 family transposase [Sphaerochaetaceae bacterium]